MGTNLTLDQVPVLKKYNRHDVTMTKRFYHESLDMIRFREELTARYQRDFMNHNDTKIGKDYFVMELKRPVSRATTTVPRVASPGRPGARASRSRTPSCRGSTSSTPSSNGCWSGSKADDHRDQGVFSDIVARVHGFDFVFGLGGIHGSVESEIIESDEGSVIVDLDVTSYYPTLAIANGFRPAHLGSAFVDIYQHLFEERKKHPKGSPENAMLKLALNRVYGDSNNVFSVFYDPLFTMSITLNGQLLLCLLAENLMEHVPGSRSSSATRTASPSAFPIMGRASRFKFVSRALGCDQVDLGAGHLPEDVHPRCEQLHRPVSQRQGQAQRVLRVRAGVAPEPQRTGGPEGRGEGAARRCPDPRNPASWPDRYDFMLRVKVPRSSYLTANDVQVQNTCRYYIAKGGVTLHKWMPPPQGQERVAQDRRRVGVDRVRATTSRGSAAWTWTTTSGRSRRLPTVCHGRKRCSSTEFSQWSVVGEPQFWCEGVRQSTSSTCASTTGTTDARLYARQCPEVSKSQAPTTRASKSGPPGHPHPGRGGVCHQVRDRWRDKGRDQDLEKPSTSSNYSSNWKHEMVDRYSDHEAAEVMPLVGRSIEPELAWNAAVQRMRAMPSRSTLVSGDH